MREATDQARATEATSQRTRQQVIYDTERTFELLVAAQQESVVAQQTLEDNQAHLHDAQVRFQARAAAKYDVLRAQVDVESARRQLTNAQADIQYALDALLQAMGLQCGDYTAVERTPPIITLCCDELLTRAYANRPEVLSFCYQIKAADEAIKAARDQRLPVITLSANYNAVSPPLPTQISNWTVALGFSMPLYDSGLITSEVREAQAQRVETMAARDAICVAIASEVRDAYTRYQAASENFSVAKEQVDVAKEAYRIAQVRYNAGVSTATEVADVQSALLTAQQGLVTAQANLGIALAEVEYSTATPLGLLPDVPLVPGSTPSIPPVPETPQPPATGIPPPPAAKSLPPPAPETPTSPAAGEQAAQQGGQEAAP